MEEKFVNLKSETNHKFIFKSFYVLYFHIY